MQTTGNVLKDRIQVLRLDYDAAEDAYIWAEDRRIWAEAKADDRTNLFSSVGIGVRGISFIVRRNRDLTLLHAFRWRGQFCFLTSIADGDPGFLTVRAALCEPRQCRKDIDKNPPGCWFPGFLTEKYIGHAQLDPQWEVTSDMVLVTPKAITLAPESWVTVDGTYYRVLVPHELDPYKNEYEIRNRKNS